jgi:hypothetical protein
LDASYISHIFNALSATLKKSKKIETLKCVGDCTLKLDKVYLNNTLIPKLQSDIQNRSFNPHQTQQSMRNVTVNNTQDGQTQATEIPKKTEKEPEDNQVDESTIHESYYDENVEESGVR